MHLVSIILKEGQNILSFMGKNKKLLLVHSAMEDVNVDESVNIMLSPQFYTLKKETLPVKYAYQAKKIAPSLFEGLLENKDSYEYAVFKTEEGWDFVAYNIEQITTFLASKGITPEKIAKVYFAQEAVSTFSSPMILNKKEALTVLDDTVVMVPSMAVNTGSTDTLKFDDSFTPSKGGISVKGGSIPSLFTQQQAYTLAIVFLLFAGMFFIEGLRYGGNDNGMQEELDVLYKEYPSLKSSYTRQDAIDKYHTMDQKERQKRDAIKSISNMIFKGVTLKYVNVNDKKIHAEFFCSNDKAKKQLQALAKKSHFKTSSKVAHQLILEEVL